MPVMYHFRVDKVIENKAEQRMYEQLKNDLENSQWNKYFEFSAKAKDMQDGNGKKFRFTAKVRNKESTIKEYTQQFSSLAKHLVTNYGIDLSDTTTTKAKLDNSIITSNKTISDETFDKLTAIVEDATQRQPTIEENIQKMATLWQQDEENIFSELQRLNTSDGMAQTQTMLSTHQEELDKVYQEAKQQTALLASRQAEIEALNTKLDASTLESKNARAQAIVDEVRHSEIPDKKTVNEIKYQALVQRNYPDYADIADVNSRAQDFSTQEFGKKIFHQYETKGLMATSSSKTSAEQAFAKKFYKDNIGKVLPHVLSTTLSELMDKHAAIDEQFLNISKTQRNIEQEKPRDTAAEIVVANNEIEKLQHALEIQNAFEKKYKQAEAVTYAFDNTPPTPIEIPTSVTRDSEGHTDNDTSSEASGTEKDDNSLAMYHYRIQQTIPSAEKKTYEDLANDLNACSTGANLFEFITKTYKEEQDKPTRFMLKVKKEQKASLQQFETELRDAMLMCQARGVDISAFESDGSKEETKNLFTRKAYVTKGSKDELDAVLTEVQSNPRSEAEAFERLVSLLPNTPDHNEFLKIAQLLHSPSLQREQVSLSQEQAYLEKTLTQVKELEDVNATLKERIKTAESATKNSTPPQHLGFDKLGFQIASTRKAIANLPPTNKTKHQLEKLSDAAPTVFGIKEYNNLLTNTQTASDLMLNKAQGVLSQGKTDKWAQAVLASNINMAIGHIRKELESVKEAHDQAMVAAQTINGINPNTAPQGSLKYDVNQKRSAVELHLENQLLQKELEYWQLALELSEGMKLAQPNEVVQEIQQISGNIAQAAIDDALHQTPKTDAPNPPISNMAPSENKAKLPPLPPERPNSEFWSKPPPPPVEKKVNAGPSGKPEGWKPPPPPPRTKTQAPKDVAKKEVISTRSSLPSMPDALQSAIKKSTERRASTGNMIDKNLEERKKERKNSGLLDPNNPQIQAILARREQLAGDESRDDEEDDRVWDPDTNYSSAQNMAKLGIFTKPSDNAESKASEKGVDNDKSSDTSSTMNKK